MSYPTSHPVPVVVVGAGLAGLATALAAAERGHPVTILEKADRVGGAAAYSGGQVWVAANHVAARLGIDDDLAAGEAYVRALAASHPELLDEAIMRRWLTHAPRAAAYFERIGAAAWEIIPGYPDYYEGLPGASANGRYLTAGASRAALGAWADRLRVSPHFPVGTSYAALFAAGQRASAFGAAADDATNGDGARHDLTFGTGVVAGFLAAVLRRGITIELEHAVTALRTTADGAVTGAVSTTPDGLTHEHAGTVVLTTSGFDWDDALAGDLLGLAAEDRGSLAPRSLTGDAIRLVRSVDGDVVRFPADRVPLLPGYPVDREPGFIGLGEHALPHSFVVDARARRFADDSAYWEIVRHALDGSGDHMPCWMVWDAQHHRKYGLGLTPPGGTYPDDVVTSAPTLEQLGAAIGVDGVQLAATAERFNRYAARGEDPDFHRGANDARRKFVGDPTQRPNPLLGPVTEAPFHALRIRFMGTGIGLSGARVDGDGRVLRADRSVIPGLYAVGGSAAFSSSGTGYNSGFALSRAITFGLLAAESLG